MNPREMGFLLLTCRFSDPVRRCLTGQQLRELKECVSSAERLPYDKELEAADLIAMGCSAELAEKTMALLSDQRSVDEYIKRGSSMGCFPVSRISSDYPQRLRWHLKDHAPGCLWLKGDLRLLSMPAIALVGSRDLQDDGAVFARTVGQLAARHGYVLISGNARGADTIAQQSCLEAGGSVISIIADSLATKISRENLLYMSEDGYDLPFSSARALSRNRLIHCMGMGSFVAQCTLGKGGTWQGVVQNLQHGWSPVFCHSDDSDAVKALNNKGAFITSTVSLHNLFEFGI